MRHLTVILIVCFLYFGGVAWGDDVTNYSLASTGTGTGNYHSNIPQDDTASWQGYFDTRTGHRYLKTGENSFSEYSKRGKFIKTVPSDFPLFLNAAGVHPITEDTFILYKKEGALEKEFALLSGYETHPSGFRAYMALDSLD